MAGSNTPANKNYHLRRLGQRGPFRVWRVDGNRIRSELDIDFNNFGQHFRYCFIPRYELWIDREAVRNEEKFYVAHMLEEWKLMNAGCSYRQALDRADLAELSERAKAGADRCPLRHRRPDLAGIRSADLGRAKAGIEVFLVRGKAVRSLLDVNFTAGGHGLVYAYVPAKEVWIDNDIVAAERPFVVLHELYERFLMDSGKTYNQAHRQACALEWRARHQASVLPPALASLGWRPLPAPSPAKTKL